MPDDEHAKILGGINRGDAIPETNAALLEEAWTQYSRIAKEMPEGSNASIGLGGFARLDPSLQPKTPEQHVALMTRLSLLVALVDRGALAEQMKTKTTERRYLKLLPTCPAIKTISARH